MSQEAGDAAAGIPPESKGERLDSWKEIAAYLNRDVSTAQRWEKKKGLPVHRKLGTVFAFKPEIDAWWNNRPPDLDAPAAVPQPAVQRWWYLAAAMLLLAAVGALVLRSYPARRARPADLVVRRVWTGPDVDRFGSVSSDGRYLAYADSNEDLTIRDLTTGTDQSLTRRPPGARTGGVLYPTFSPDGKHIAFVRARGFFHELCLIGRDGAGERTLFQDADVVVIEIADWSPDGRSVLALLGKKNNVSEIALIGAGNGSVRILKTLDWLAPSKMSFSPDGRYIAYDRQPRRDSTDRDVFVLAAGGGGERALIQHPSDDFLLGWAPDGKTILFGSDRAGSTDAWSQPFAEKGSPGAPSLLKRNLGKARPLGFSRDGSYYYGIRAWESEVYVAGLDIENGKLADAPVSVATHFEGETRSPDWSADGRLAYLAQPGPFRMRSAPRVVIRSADGREERALTPKLTYAASLRWSPDARSFLISGYDLGNRAGVFRVDAQSGDATPLVQSYEPREYFLSPAPAGDGKALLYKLTDQGTEPSRLLSVNLRSAETKELVPSVYRFDVSRDGSKLVYCSFDEHAEFIQVRNVSGGGWREVHREPRNGRIYSVAWTPDDRYILYSKLGQLWRIRAEGGDPQELPLSAEALRELRVHPDGSRLAFTAGSGKGELWVMQNFLPPAARE